MTPERWQQAYDLFAEVIRRAPAEREAMIEAQCAGDPELRALVHGLLSSDEQADREGFLAPHPAPGSAALRPTILESFLRNTIHLRCPHCHNPIELVNPNRDDEVLCPTCGSSFNVRRPANLPWNPEQGKKIVGRFELIETVGAGAFGTVYRAHDLGLDRDVALKVLRGVEFAGNGERERFLREPRNAAQLRHPAIVTVHELGEHDGIPFIISDFVRGVTLADWLKARRPEPREAARLAAEIAAALQYAHDHGVIHRDVKPSNIMLDEAGRPYLMDFGLAKREAAEITITIEGEVLGTPAYMSPEQARGETGRIDAKSDVYSLGVVLYEMLTGETPFHGSTRMLLHQVQYDDPRSPRALNDRIPRDLETICLKAMAKEPPRRYARAQELADDLGRFLNGVPIHARPVGSIERAWRWCRRNPRLAAALGSTAASLVAIAVLSIVFAINRTALLAESNRHLALADFELGRDACERGEIGPGLHWLHRSLKAANDAGDSAWARTARANLAAWRREYPVLKAVFSHRGEVTSAAISPDGRLALTASDDHTARLWDLADGKPIGSPLRHEDQVLLATFSPDGRLALTTSEGGSARLWDARTGQPVGQPLRHESLVRAAAFSRDGKILLTGSYDSTAQLWDVATGRPLGGRLRHGDRVNAVALSPDGRIALTGSDDRTARLWGAADGRPLGRPLQHAGRIWSVAFRPDGRMVATTSADQTARLWDATTGQPLHGPLRHQGEVYEVVFSPDGQTLLTAGDDKTARLWDAATGLARGEPLRHDDRLWSVAFSPDGKTVATASTDQTARLWDAATGRPLGRPFPHQGFVYSAAFSPDGQTLLTSSSDHTARLWLTTAGPSPERLVPHRSTINVVSFSPDGQFIPIGTDGGEARLWDPAAGQFRGHPLPHGERISALALSPDGTVALIGSFDGKFQIRMVATGEPLGAPIRFRGQVSAVAFSPDGRIALAASHDGTARLCDVATGQPRGEPLRHGDQIIRVAFSPDGKTVWTASGDRTARPWDAATGRPLGKPIPHTETVMAVAVSPDGTTILTASLDGTARLWDAATGELRRELRHQAGVLNAAFSPDGRFALTGSYDRTARLWEVASGRPVGPPLRHHGPVGGLAFSPDSQLVLTGGEDGTARLWDAGTGRPIGPPLEHPGRVTSVAFRPDGNAILARSDDGAVRLWTIARLSPDLDRLSAWIEGLTGLEMDEQGVTHVLDTDTWTERRGRLAPGVGPPRPGEVP